MSGAAAPKSLAAFARTETGDADSRFAAATVGLRTREEYAKAAKDREAGGGKAAPRSLDEEEAAAARDADRARETTRRADAAERKALSFADEGEGEEHGDEERGDEKDAAGTKRARSLKDPGAETSFLPDREREMHRRRAEERLKREWEAQREAQRNETVQIVFSFWNGSGTRRQLDIKRGTTVAEFLEMARQALWNDFPELRRDAQLMFIKEDLIIPGVWSFDDLIMSKARGKSGPLFDFGVHDDVRLVSDARTERDESHPAKVCQRSWYERNKGNFPASRWETFDPNADYGRFTIR